MINYKEERNKLFDALETEFNSLKDGDDNESLLSILDKMISYKMVQDADDEHYKAVKKKVGLKALNFSRDFRAGVEYNSAWVLGNNEDMYCTVVCNQHIGKRIEGNYEGDVTVERREMPLVLSEIRKFPLIKRVRDRLKAIEQSNGYKHIKLPETFENSVKNGKYLVYKVEVARGNFLRNEFGYILVNKSKDYDTINVMLCIDKKSLDVCNVNIDKALKIIKNTIKNSLEKLNDGCSVKIVELQ